MGESGGPTLGWLPSSLAKAGVGKEEIGLILMTHLHPDHCGGLVDEKGHAVFPNATLVVHEDELDFWLTLEESNALRKALNRFLIWLELPLNLTSSGNKNFFWRGCSWH